MAEETYKINGYAGQPITLPTLESLSWKKDNYIFLGWGKTKDAKIIETRDGGTVLYEDNTDLYALWAPTDYLYFNALENNVKILLVLQRENDSCYPDVDLEYSKDNKKTWITWKRSSSKYKFDNISLDNVGDRIYIRAKNKNNTFAKYETSYNEPNHWTFKITGGKTACAGNIMSLLDKDILLNYVTEYCFSYLFKGCTNLITSPDLPALLLNNHCYDNMFAYCTNLILPPKELPALELYSYCYNCMFAYCTSLQSLPLIAANVVCQNECMSKMFSNTYIKNAYIKLSIPATCLGFDTTYMFEQHNAGLSVEVDFTTWENSGINNYWLKSNQTYSAGTFICPQELKSKFDNGTIVRNNNTVPTNWTIVAKQ